MSYTKQTWANGDVITADKLNHIEDGINSANSNSNTLLVTFTGSDYDWIGDKTYGEILNAFESGKAVICKKEYEGIEDAEYTPIIYLSYSPSNLNTILTIITQGMDIMSLQSNGSLDDYPTLYIGG